VVFSHPVGLYQDLREYAEGSDCVVIVDIALDELRVADVVPPLPLPSRKALKRDALATPSLSPWATIVHTTATARGPHSP
jgi:hypothetical protein